MISRREFKLPVTPSTHLLEEYIVNQMKYLDGRLADNIEVHMEKNHKDGKRISRRFQYVTDCTQY